MNKWSCGATSPYQEGKRHVPGQILKYRNIKSKSIGTKTKIMVIMYEDVLVHNKKMLFNELPLQIDMDLLQTEQPNSI